MSTEDEACEPTAHVREVTVPSRTMVRAFATLRAATGVAALLTLDQAYDVWNVAGFTWSN